MKRNFFIRTVVAMGAIALTPLSALGRQLGRFRTDKGFMVGSGEDRNKKSFSPFKGDTFFTKISTVDTDGDLFVFESIRSNNDGPIEHVHYTQDEWWYVLKGAFTIKIGNTVYEAKEGDSVFGPRMVPHVWAKNCEGEGRLLITFQPAGKMEEFFKALSEGKAKGLSAEGQNEFRKAHGFEMTGPALGKSKMMGDEG